MHVKCSKHPEKSPSARRRQLRAAAACAAASDSCLPVTLASPPTPLPATLQPRALNYEASPAPRSSRLQRDSSLQREPSLQRGSSAKPPPMRVGSTPARTPRMPSRFGVPAAHDAAATTGANGSAPMDDDTIRVVLRVRPRNERETTGGGGVCVQPLSASGVRVASHPEPHSFSFDYVAGDATTQETIFRGACAAAAAEGAGGVGTSLDEVSCCC